jgi:hypothetical protein
MRRQDCYWYSALGSRNTQTSRLYQGLEQLWRLDRLLAAGADLSLVVPDRAVLPLVRSLARARGVEARFHGGYPRRGWLDPLRRPWGALRYMLALCDFGRSHGDYGPVDNDTIVVTVSMTSLLQPDRRVRDLCSATCQRIAAAGRVLMPAQITGDPRPGPVPARTLPPPPPSHRGRPRPAARCHGRRPCVPRLGGRASDPHGRLGIDLAPLLRLDAAASRWRDLPAAEMLRAALARLLRRSPRAVLLHPFENNGWEHACQAAARPRAQPDRRHPAQCAAAVGGKTYASRHRPHPGHRRHGTDGERFSRTSSAMRRRKSRPALPSGNPRSTAARPGARLPPPSAASSCCCRGWRSRSSSSTFSRTHLRKAPTAA